MKLLEQDSKPSINDYKVVCDKSEYKWDQRFLELAQLISTWSKDPSTKVGAVIAKGNRIISLGFNGFASGVKDLADRYNDRNFKYPAVIHGEENALLFAKQDLNNCTIYVYPMPPCASCAAKIIQSGITRVVSIEIRDEGQKERWGENNNIAKIMFDEANVELDLY